MNKENLPDKSAGQPRRRRRWVWGASLIALAVAGAAAFHGYWPATQAKPVVATSSPPIIPVTAIHAVKQDLPISRSGLGTVYPLNQVDVKVRVDGQVQKLNFSEGQNVNAGDVVAEIDPRPYRAQLAQAEAALQKDTAQLNSAKTEEVRASKLNSVGAGTSQASDNAKSQVAINQALLQGDQAAIDTAKLNLAFATVRAPIAGRVGLKQVNEGAIVRASDATGIVTVTQMHPIAVQFSLPQDELPDLLVGQAKRQLSVAIDSRDGSRHLADGKLTVIDSQVDTSTGTIRLKAEFDNGDNALWPGALVTARVVVRTDVNATVVPALAVQNGQKGPYVFLAKPDGTAAIANVVTGPTVGDVTALTSGVAPGDNVVLSGQSRLAQGAKIKVIQADGDTQHVALESN